jgi:hypothetical protein
MLRQDTWLDHVIGRAMMEATGADVALLPVTQPRTQNLAGVSTGGEPLLTATLTAAQIRALLEREISRFPTYDFRPGQPAPGRMDGDSALDAFHGLSYELDLTRPAGARVIHLAFRGESLSMERPLKVAVTASRVALGDPELASARPGASPVALSDTLVRAGRRAAPGHQLERAWTVLPDYLPCVERPLIDRLVREGALPREEAMRLFPDEPARRGDFAYWVARAFGWREQRLSGAWSDVPDSLEPWVDGLARHHVLDVSTRTSEQFEPFGVVTLGTALAWCGGAAPALREMKDGNALRKVLLAHTSLETGTRSAPDTLTRAQVLGMVANARSFSRK